MISKAALGQPFFVYKNSLQIIITALVRLFSFLIKFCVEQMAIIMTVELFIIIPPRQKGLSEATQFMRTITSILQYVHI